MARLSATGRDGIEHHYLLHWSDGTAVQVFASFIRQSSLPGHPLTPTLAGGFIAALRADGRIDWPTIRDAYTLAHKTQMAEAAAIVYGGVATEDIPVSVSASKPNQSNHVRPVDCGAAVEPTGEKADAPGSADSPSAVGSDHRHWMAGCEAPARIGRRARVSIFLLGIFQAAIVAAAIAAFVFTFAWGD